MGIGMGQIILVFFGLAVCRAEIAPAPSRATFESVIYRNQVCAKLRTLPNFYYFQKFDIAFCDDLL